MRIEFIFITLSPTWRIQVAVGCVGIGKNFLIDDWIKELKLLLKTEELADTYLPFVWYSLLGNEFYTNEYI